MFSLIKQMFIVLLSFSESLAGVTKVSDRIKYLSFNGELCIVRPTLIDLNPVGLNSFPFMIS